jgi:hypothetical protein
MGRTLNEVERADAARMCEALEGSPGRILGAGEWAWEQERPLSEVVAALRPRSLQADRVVEVSAAERAVLGVLAAVEPAPVHASHLVEVTRLQDPTPVLESLERRGLYAPPLRCTT